jgi:hypothetical protein
MRLGSGRAEQGGKLKRKFRCSVALSGLGCVVKMNILNCNSPFQNPS